MRVESASPISVRAVTVLLLSLTACAADLCSDPVFLRRAYLDAIGTLPTAAEASSFLADRDPGKRAALIDALLQRDEFAVYNAMRWADLLRIKAEFPINLWPMAAQGYHRWVLDALRRNMPYDQFARALLTGSGSNFRDPPVNFYRAVQSKTPEGLARAVSLTFLGIEEPSPELVKFLVPYVSQVAYKETREWKEEIVYHKGFGPDPRVALADWVTGPKNPYFKPAIVARIRFWLTGEKLDHEEVPASNDLKSICRAILNSDRYQAPRVPPRRLDAEVLIDALNQITGSTESYTSQIPEPFTVMPPDQRAIALPDGSLTSPFLELFGRPARDTGLYSERNNKLTDAMRLHLLNSTHIQRKLNQGPKLIEMMRNARQPRELVNQLYLAILSRYPTAEEWKTMTEHSQTVKGRDAVMDLAWALINTDEFLYRH